MTFKMKLEINQGATFRKKFVWKVAGDDGADPVAVDLTGYTAKMQVRATVEATAVLVELSTTNSRITLGGTTGEIELYLSPAVTDAFTWKSGVYDLELTSASGEIERLLAGAVTVVPGVTRD